MTGEGRLELLKRVVARHQYEEVPCGPGRTPLLIDVQTANAMLTIHSELGSENRHKYLHLSWPRAVDITWKLVAKIQEGSH
jgi:hypothetical protein